MGRVNKKRMHEGGGLYGLQNHDHPHDCECHKECWPNSGPINWTLCYPFSQPDEAEDVTGYPSTDWLGGGCYQLQDSLNYVGPLCGLDQSVHIHEHNHPHAGHDGTNLNNNNNRRNTMARGRRAPARKRGGRVGRAPARKMARGGRSMARGGARVGTCGGPGQPRCGGGKRGGHRSGGRMGRPAPRGRAMARGGRMGRPSPRGRTRPQPRRMARGGRAGVRRMPGGGNIGGYNYGNTGCNMWTSKIDCDAKPGCSWNFDDSCCH